MTDPADRSTDDRTGDTSGDDDAPRTSWYDATAFGTDDGRDVASIQRAVDTAADDGGGTVLLPAGEYRLEEPVTLRSGVRIRGAGAGATTVAARGEGFAAFEGFGNVEEPLTDLAIGDLAENDESGVVVSGKPDTSYEACGHRIADCHLVDNTGHGIEVRGAANRSGIGVDDCTIVGCSVRGNGTAGDAAGIRLEAGEGRYRGVTLVANRCYEFASGITLSGPHERVLLLGNDLSGVEDAIASDERPELLRHNLGHPTEAGGRRSPTAGGSITGFLRNRRSRASSPGRPRARSPGRSTTSGSSSGWSTSTAGGSTTPNPSSGRRGSTDRRSTARRPIDRNA